MDIPGINKQVNEIANDKISGSNTIARKSLECIDAFAGWVIENTSGITLESYTQELINLSRDLVNAQPLMAAVINGVNHILSSTINESQVLQNEPNTDEESKLKYISTFTKSAARKHILESQLALEVISKSYKEIIHDKDVLMTISASSAVESILTEAFKDSIDFTIYIPESRPMNEGKLLAERLAGKGINSILIADSAMFHFLKECSSIIVGADHVTTDGVVNKIGTYGLGLAGNELNKPFYCVCEQAKFIPNIFSSNAIMQAQPEEQLFTPDKDKTKPEKLIIKNIYFDFTPMEYITKFLTEDGIITKERVKKYIKGLEIIPELASIFAKE
jgi:translation initiation factor 2B subunit (eIF-2B alpha/beta/delta family)